MRMLISRAQNIVRDPIKRPSRIGKTKQDKANGSWARHLKNRVDRGDRDRG